jgi:aspartate racemase
MKIGIVGGVTWSSTVAYYSGICRLAEQARFSAESDGVRSFPEFAIESLNHNRAVATLGKDPDEHSWTAFDAYHSAALRRLERSGAEFALIASNTPHHRFSAISKGIGIPVLNLFDELAAAAEAARAKDVLILGTAVTMMSAPLKAAFEKRGIRARGPGVCSVRERAIKLIGDIHAGNEDGALGRLEEIVCVELDARPARELTVCLGCTELPLLFGNSEGSASFEHKGVTFLDSLQVHIMAAYQIAVGARGFAP